MAVASCRNAAAALCGAVIIAVQLATPTGFARFVAFGEFVVTLATLPCVLPHRSQDAARWQTPS